MKNNINTMAGTTWGYYKVVGRDPNHKRRVMCRCKCGTIKSVAAKELRRGNTKSCGCKAIENRSNSIIDEVGNTYGDLTVIEKYNNPEDKGQHWLCKCRCGKTSIRKGTKLRRTQTAKCTHRVAKDHYLYASYTSMRQRCTDSNRKDYPNYGGRGIKVCSRWLDSFWNFLDDMGDRPNGCSIDRIDNDGDYTPNNCRWATATEQRLNQRKVKKS